MDSNTPKLSLRTIEPTDYPELAELMDSVFPDVGGSWPRLTIMDLIHQFPDGQICIEDNGKIVGAALTMTLNLPYTWIGTAKLDLKPSGHGTLAFELIGETRISYLMSWPHVRPWRMARTQPALRIVNTQFCQLLCVVCMLIQPQTKRVFYYT